MRRRVRGRAEQGAAAVELALMLPFLLVLVFGMIDFGFMINRQTVINNAAREGVRQASLGAPQAEIEAAVRAALGGIGHATVEVSCTTPSDDPCASWGVGATSGGTAEVTVTYVNDWVTPVGATFSDDFSLVESSQMRIE